MVIYKLELNHIFSLVQDGYLQPEELEELFSTAPERWIAFWHFLLYLFKFYYPPFHV